MLKIGLGLICINVLIYLVPKTQVGARNEGVPPKRQGFVFSVLSQRKGGKSFCLSATLIRTRYWEGGPSSNELKSVQQPHREHWENKLGANT